MDEIGELQFVQTTKARYIRITLKPSGIVRVTVPGNATIEQAKAFVETKIEWIKQKRAEISVNKNKKIIFTPQTVFSLRNRQLQLKPWKSEQYRTQLSKESLTIFFPCNVDIQSDKTQKIIHDYIVKAIREEAKDYLPKRTKELAAIHNFSYRNVRVKNLSSRWGSCSTDNNINLNIHLVRLPQHLCDYVILHELVHTVHKNHKEIFWQSLDKITEGKAKLLAKEMKQEHWINIA